MNPLDILAMTCIAPTTDWIWNACRAASGGTWMNPEYNDRHDRAAWAGQYHEPYNH